MSELEVKELEKAVTKARFALSQKAGLLHDLIEDRLPADYKEIPSYAEAVYKAAQYWDLLNQKLMVTKNQALL